MHSSSEYKQPKIKSELRIVNGFETTTIDWPWVVSLRLDGIYGKDGSIYNQHVCGGSIIRRSKPAAILTAAHCIEWFDDYDPKYWTIWIDIGRDDVSFDLENITQVLTHDTSSYKSYKMSKYVYHPNVTYDSYYQNMVIHDIGIVFIDNELPITQPIITMNNDINWIQNDDDFILIGYGWDGWDTKMLTDTLEQTNVRFVNDNQCNILIDKYFNEHWTIYNYTLFLEAIGIKYGDINAYPYNILQCEECIICAVGENSDACNGDSGSPLIKLNDKNETIQIGIVSFGFECNVKHVPGQYTDVAYYYDWIQHELSNSLHSDSKGNVLNVKFVNSIIIAIVLAKFV